MAGPWDKELQLKHLFAIAVLKKPLRKPQDSYDIATTIFGGDTVAAMRAGASWPADPDVLRIKDELIAAHGVEFFLPTKEEIARDLLDIANEKYDNGHLRHDAREREKLLRLYCEVMGFIEKPKPGGKDNGEKPALPDIIMQEYPDEPATA